MSLSFCVQKVESTGIGFPYSAFNEFRHRIGRSLGLKGVYSMTPTDMYITKRYMEIEDTHPLYPLIDHSDCDGALEPEDCGQIGAYLKESLVPEWKKELEEGGSNDELDYDIKQGERLADLMLKCYENGDTLLFI